jgi:hypothetical protein
MAVEHGISHAAEAFKEMENARPLRRASGSLLVEIGQLLTRGGPHLNITALHQTTLHLNHFHAGMTTVGTFCRPNDPFLMTVGDIFFQPPDNNSAVFLVSLAWLLLGGHDEVTRFMQMARKLG